MKRRLLIPAGIAILGLSSACNGFGACTLIGCLNGLTVDLGANAMTSYRVEVRSPSGQSVSVQECSHGANCTRYVWYPDYYPATAIIKVITAAGTREVTVDPEYQESYPNGRGCGPACRRATVPVAMP